MSTSNTLSTQSSVEWKRRQSRNSSSRDRLADLEWLAHWLDNAIRLPGGIRLGLDPLLGLIPGLGDTLGLVAAIYFLQAARRMAVPKATVARMAINIFIDYLFGLVPFLGDLFDVYWKANVRNVKLLRRHLDTNPAALRRARHSDQIFVTIVMVVLVALLMASIALVFWGTFALANFLFGTT